MNKAGSIIQQAAACKHGEIGELLRREKLYSNQLSQWRREFAKEGVAGIEKSAPGPASKKTSEQKRIEQRRLQHHYKSEDARPSFESVTIKTAHGLLECKEFTDSRYLLGHVNASL